jgi:hypothetical protein
MGNCLRRMAAVVSVWLLLQPSVFAFDTFWHSAATGAVGRQFKFSEDANNILQFGNFAGPDFFGPLYDSIGGKQFGEANAAMDAKPKSQAVLTFMNFRGTAPAPIRRAAIYMHFDNLNGKITKNSQFDYLFLHLLWNTQAALNKIYSDGNLNEGLKKIAILETLGASLHMVQDFYSHSDWTHNDFEKMGVPLVKTSWGKMRAPTWFEVRAKLGDPDNWPFKVRSGIYPPKEGETYSHTHMNHDNSQLFYEKESQVPFHGAGPFPADKGISEHQLFAVNSAAGAGIEWTGMLMTFSGARQAIEYARTWDVKKFNPAMEHDLETGLSSTLLLSCAVSKWDGDNPPQQRKNNCLAMFGAAPGLTLTGGMSLIPTPFNEFWSVELKQNIPVQLTKGFGKEDDDNYVFDPTFVKSTFPSGAPRPIGISGL